MATALLASVVLRSPQATYVHHYLCTFTRMTCSIAHRAVQAWCRSTLVTMEVRYASPDYMYGWPAAPLRRGVPRLLQQAATQVIRDRPVGRAALSGSENALRLAASGRCASHPLRAQPFSRHGAMVDCRRSQDVAH